VTCVGLVLASSVEMTASVLEINFVGSCVVRSSDKMLLYFVFHENWRCVPSSVDDCEALLRLAASEGDL
jgi:hypothetical protein